MLKYGSSNFLQASLFDPKWQFFYHTIHMLRQMQSSRDVSFALRKPLLEHIEKNISKYS